MKEVELMHLYQFEHNERLQKRCLGRNFTEMNENLAAFLNDGWRIEGVEGEE